MTPTLVRLPHRLVAVCVAGCCVLFTGCARDVPAEPVIGASIPPLAALVREITGDRIAVVSLLPSGRSPHDYDPTPADLSRLRHARLFVTVGTEVDGWMENAVRGTMESEAPVVAMSDVAPAGADPHLWLDLDVVRAFVPKLTEKLARRDPEAASIYLERAGNFLKRLEEFDHQAGVALTPHIEAAFALHHPAFVPFVERYGLNLVAVLQVHPEGEAKPRTLGDVVQKMRGSGARILFGEPQLGTRLAESVAVDLDARLAMLDGLGGEGMEGRETYIGLLQWNLRQLLENLDARGD